jgi:aryl-alcohol dehydrogenase-like predicted oxidoreductase
MLTQRGGGADGTAFQDNDFRSRLPRGWVHWSAAAAGRLAPAAAEVGGLPLLALRYCLSFPEVSAVIPGMHKQRHVEDLLAAKACGPLAPDLLARIDTLVERCYPAWA